MTPPSAHILSTRSRKSHTHATQASDQGPEPGLHLAICSAITGRLTPLCSVSQATCGQLSSLDLRLCTKVTGTAVLAIARNCPSLTALYVERAGRISDDCVHALASGCPELRTLDLGWCEVGDSALHALAAGCPKLQVPLFTSTTHLDGRAHRSFC